MQEAAIEQERCREQRPPAFALDTALKPKEAGKHRQAQQHHRPEPWRPAMVPPHQQRTDETEEPAKQHARSGASSGAGERRGTRGISRHAAKAMARPSGALTKKTAR